MTVCRLIDNLTKAQITSVGDLMGLPKLQAIPLLKKNGLHDGQIESLKSILNSVDAGWSDWPAATINLAKSEQGRGGKRTHLLLAQELVEERTTDADRANYHLPAEFHEKQLPAHLGGGVVSRSLKLSDCRTTAASANQPQRLASGRPQRWWRASTAA
jgi:hypothetical protein